MSKPVSNDEVEDVLSSIRRLVSEDKRPLQNTTPKPSNGRLMLTPALRVAGDDHDEPQISAPSSDDMHSTSREDEHAQARVEALLGDAPEEGATRAEDDSALYDTYSEDPVEEAETADAEPIPASWQEDDLTEDHTSDTFWDDEPQDEREDVSGTSEAESAVEDHEDEHSHAAEEEKPFADDDGFSPEDLHRDDDPDEDTGDEQVLFVHREPEIEAVLQREDDEEGEMDPEDGFADLSSAQDETDEGEVVAEAREVDPSVLTAKIAALETAIGSIRQEWEPDDPGSDAYSGTNGPTLEWEDNVELDARGKPIQMDTPLDEDADIDDIEEAAFEEAAVEEETDDRAEDVSRTEETDTQVEPREAEEAFNPSEVTDLEDVQEAEFGDAVLAEEALNAALEEIANEAEPAASTTDPETDALDDVPFDEAAFEEYAAQFDPQDENAPEADSENAEFDVPEAAALAAGLTGDDAVLDEEMLRELVSEIVRSELQGALGERITRNVRKLVRREIHRALAAQELE